MNIVSTFPTGIRMAPALSPLHSADPDSRRMYSARSSVTVPRRSEGISPLGPSTRPSLGVMARIRDGAHRIVVAWCFPLITYSQIVERIISVSKEGYARLQSILFLPQCQLLHLLPPLRVYRLQTRESYPPS